MFLLLQYMYSEAEISTIFVETRKTSLFTKLYQLINTDNEFGDNLVVVVIIQFQDIECHFKHYSLHLQKILIQ